MKRRILFYSILILTLIFNNQTKCNSNVDLHNQETTLTQDIDSIDFDTLNMIKVELENTKNLLIQAQNNQNPELQQKACSGLSDLLSKLGCLAASTAIWVGGPALMIHPDKDYHAKWDHLEHTKLGHVLTLVSFPTLIIFITITYAILRQIFSSNTNQALINIEVHSEKINQIINQLNNKINKIDEVLKQLKTEKIKD